ncbi:MAG: glycosyltransferase family 2 protein [Chloroflexi bacterium]|nr:glycosyltransferase family 2 protein [Chloroflexota bacterium]
MYRGLSISVVIPCFNEEHGIKHVIENMPSYVDEIVVVNNNSTDDTEKVAHALGATVIFEGKKGYGNAYKAGLPRAKGDIIATADGDGTYPTGAIAPAIDYLLARNLDFISASRFPLKNPQAMSQRNYLGNMILTWVMRILFFTGICDSQSGMWIFRRACLEKMQLVSPGMPFSEEIKIEAVQHPGIRFGELHIDYHERIGETKLFTWRDGFENLTFLAKRRLHRTTKKSLLPTAPESSS